MPTTKSPAKKPLPTPKKASLTIDLVAAAPHTVRADLLAVPVFTGPRARSRRRCGRRSARRHPARVRVGGGIRGQAGRGARGADRRPARREGGRAGGHGRPRHDRRRRDAPGRCRAGDARSPRSRRSRPRCSTPRPTPSIAPMRRRRSPKGSRSAPTSSSRTSPTRSRHASRVSRCSGVRTRRSATGWRAALRIAQAVAWARDLVNEPAEAKSPETVVKLARALARANGLTVRVWSGAQLVRERLGGVVGVGHRLRSPAAIPPARVRAARRDVPRWRSSARVWCSTPAGCRSRPPAAWRR